MRRSLVWLLAATSMLSVGAVSFKEFPHVVEAVAPRLPEAVLMTELHPINNPTQESPSRPLPVEMPIIDVDPAKRNIFLPFAPPVVAPPPMEPTVRQAPPTAPSLTSAQPMQAPVMNLRFLGSMVTPSGQRLVYLARGDAILPVVAGDRLDDGYVITAVSNDAVTITFPPTETVTVIPITEPSQP